jgi:hypothetical protein
VGDAPLNKIKFWDCNANRRWSCRKAIRGRKLADVWTKLPLPHKEVSLAPSASETKPTAENRFF